MENLGFEVKSKTPRRLPDGSIKADWDMQIAIDPFSLADKVDGCSLSEFVFIFLIHRNA
jgi:uncharacterized LabA/DUF88 family protein